MNQLMERFTDADAALARVTELYDAARAALVARFAAFADGDHASPAPAAFYPYVAIESDGALAVSRPLLS